MQGQIDNYLCELQQSADENNASGVFRKGAIVHNGPPFGQAVKFSTPSFFLTEA
jgi:hypothetical protein